MTPDPGSESAASAGDDPAPPADEKRSPAADENRSFPLAGVAAIGLTLFAAWGGPLLAKALPTPRLVPSTSTVALILGALLGAFPGARQRLAAGAQRVSKTAIPAAIVLIGFGLEGGSLLEGGSFVSSLAVVLLSMTAAFVAALVFGRLLGLDPRTSLLIGAGTAVCGNSAILAVAPVVKPPDEDVALSVGVITLLSVVMLFGIPALAGGIGLEEARGGAVAGLTVHALPQALAAGETLGAEALEAATLYKLMRVAMLAPLVLILATALRRKGGSEGAKRAGIPLYLVLFAVAAGLRSLGAVDSPVAIGGVERPLWEWATLGGKGLLAIALAAIGMGLEVRRLVRVGPRVLAAAVAAVVCLIGVAVLLVSWLL
ncbi:putative sulfate exporter family transporter [Planctomycetota bacterium]|nr:putative sulfate exporter family transporter [Planctomycetota bacterium]